MKVFLAAIVVLFFVSCFFSLNSAFAYLYEPEDEEGFYQILGVGPVAVRNQMPLYLFYLQMVPDKASVVERNRFVIDADYTVSNITVSAFTPTSSLYDIQIDLEVQRITLDFRYGIYDNLEIGLEVPYIGLCSGYLDNAIEGFEDGIGARTPRSRERQGSYEFDYSFRYDGKYLIQQKTSTQGLGDIVLTAKYQLLKESEWHWLFPNISVRSAIKFPTADEVDLIGSGEFDYGFGILIDKGFFDRFFVYMGASVMRIEKPDIFSVLGIDQEFYSYMLALEYFFTERLSVVTQVTGNNTPYSYSQTNPLDNDAHDWTLGCNYRWKEKTNVAWNFAIVENISAASSPDVSFNTSLNWGF